MSRECRRRTASHPCSMGSCKRPEEGLGARAYSECEERELREGQVLQRWRETDGWVGGGAGGEGLGWREWGDSASNYTQVGGSEGPPRKQVIRV